jgi:hypothetical protein
MLRIHLNQPKASFEQRLAQEALRVQEQIKSLPQGKERDFLSLKARQLETASHINEWLSSPGLRPPPKAVRPPQLAASSLERMERSQYHGGLFSVGPSNSTGSL